MNIFYRKKNPQGKWFYMQSDLSYLIVGKKKYIYVTYQDVSALHKNEELSNTLRSAKKRIQLNIADHLDVLFHKKVSSAASSSAAA